VNQIKKGSNSFQIKIAAEKIVEDVKIGDSIAVNGVCLTVIEYARGYFVADVMPETYIKTTLKTLKNGSRVNLERSLRLSDRMGGHVVQGHVDGIGIIVSKEKDDIAIIYRIKADSDILKYVVAKGSIAVDGISLTVIKVSYDSFTISLIPHTAEMTVLGQKAEGDGVNLESDIVGRYIEKLISNKTQSDEKPGVIDVNYLAENGFI